MQNKESLDRGAAHILLITLILKLARRENVTVQVTNARCLEEFLHAFEEIFGGCTSAGRCFPFANPRCALLNGCSRSRRRQCKNVSDGSNLPRSKLRLYICAISIRKPLLLHLHCGDAPLADNLAQVRILV